MQHLSRIKNMYSYHTPSVVYTLLEFLQPKKAKKIQIGRTIVYYITSRQIFATRNQNINCFITLYKSTVMQKCQKFEWSYKNVA